MEIKLIGYITETNIVGEEILSISVNGAEIIDNAESKVSPYGKFNFPVTKEFLNFALPKLKLSSDISEFPKLEITIKLK